MSNEFYDHVNVPATGSPLSSATMRAEFSAVEQGFDKLPTLAGNNNKIVKVNPSGTALETTDTPDINGGTIDDAAVNLDGGSLVLPQGTATAPITEGQVYWNTSTDTLTVGNGAAAEVMVTTDNTQTLTNKTINLTSNTLVATSAQLATALTDETGTGSVVFSASPALTGTPTAPTAAAATNTTQIATTAHVFAERTNTATLTNKTLTNPAFSGTTANMGTVTTIDINGGTIDGTTIGASTRAAGNFTTLDANGNVILGDASTDTVTVNGYMGVGIAPVGNYAVFVAPSNLTGTAQQGVRALPVGTSSATSSVTGIVAGVRTQEASFTVLNGMAVNVVDAIKGAGSTITDQYGIRIENQTQGTNNFGITSLVSSGTNKWNIYASGTAANYFAGNVQFAAGAVGTPSLTRFGDDNTGFWFPAADTLAASTGGSERLRIDSSGNVGIGTSSPGGTVGYSASTRILGIAGDGSENTTSYGAINFQNNRATPASGDLFGALTGESVNSVGRYKASILLQADGAGGATGGFGARITFSTRNNDSASGPVERLRIDSTGNVGIGTSSPANRLHVDGVIESRNTASGGGMISSRAITPGGSGVGVGGLEFRMVTTGTTYVAGALMVALSDGAWSSTSAPMHLSLRTAASGTTTAAERLRIDSSGNTLQTQPAPAAVNASATLTVANLRTRIITSTTAALVTGTLPTGTLMDGMYSATADMGYDWSVINTGGSNNFVVGAGATHTVIGNMTVSPNTTGMFRSRRVDVNTWITYRIG
jgi:hypothetical protein